MKDIKGYEGKYAVTKDGEVWSYPKPLSGALKGKGYTKGKWLNQIPYSCGYLAVHLRGPKRMELIHRIVAKTYISNTENKKCVNHLDGIKTNNKIENLEWCTYSENMHHASKKGLIKPNKKLNSDQIKNITMDREKGMTFQLIANKYKVGRATIYRAIKGIGY